MTLLQAPGVYWETVEPLPRAGEVRLDVPAFVGIAQRGPLDRPVRVVSLRDFEAVFGGPIAQGVLAYAVRAFFENGGAAAWVVRVASRDPAMGARAAEALLPGSIGGALPQPAWRIAASSPGTWGNGLSVVAQPGTRVVARSIPLNGDRARLEVSSPAGFEAASLVRLSQGAANILRVVASVDGVRRRLEFLPPPGEALAPWHREIAGLDPAQPMLIEKLTVTLVIRDGGRVVAVARDLSYVPGHRRYGPHVLGAPSYAERPEQVAFETSGRAAEAPFPVVIEAASDPAIGLVPLTADGLTEIGLGGGRDGLAALMASDVTGIGVAEAGVRRGLAALELVDEPAAIAVPDACGLPDEEFEYEALPYTPADPCAPCGNPAAAARLRPRPPGERRAAFGQGAILAIQQAMVEHCEARRDRLALLDPPHAVIHANGLGFGPLEDWRNQFDSGFAALFVPWLVVADPRGTPATRLLPPSGHVAGQLARTDRLQGVHRAAANFELAWAEAASVAIGETDHGELNRRGIDVIRAMNGRPPRLLGARLLGGDPAIRDVPVRRVIILIRRCLARLLAGIVFEPHNEALRERVEQTVTTFLTGLWQAGALAGAAPEEAFAVGCDEDNNPASGRDNGRLVCDIAIAPVRPLEFVVLRLGIAGNEIEATELPAMTGGSAS